MKTNISAALLALCFANCAHAEIFICKDANGRTLTSDRPIPECTDRAQRILNPSGTIKREIAAPLTAEQKKQAQDEESKKKAAIKAAEEQKRQDRALLARFKSEADIETARKRDLGLVQDQIKREELSIVAKEKNLQDAKKESEFYKNKVLPSPLQRKIEDSEQAIVASKKMIKDKQSEIAQINAKYDQTLTRYRELNPDSVAASASASTAASARAPSSSASVAAK